MGGDAFCETSEFVGCAVEPVVGIGTVDELGMFVGFAGGCIYEGVGGVKCSSNVGDLGGNAGQVVLYDNVGLNMAATGAMGMMGWEALSTFSAVGASCGGTTLGPSCAGNAGVDVDAGLQESGSVGGLFLYFCGTTSTLTLPWVNGG
jgi:hypothetical protein